MSEDSKSDSPEEGEKSQASAPKQETDQGSLLLGQSIPILPPAEAEKAGPTEVKSASVKVKEKDPLAEFDQPSESGLKGAVSNSPGSAAPGSPEEKKELNEVQDPLAEFDSPSGAPSSNQEDAAGVDEIPTVPLPVVEGVTPAINAKTTAIAQPAPAPSMGAPRPKQASAPGTSSMPPPLPKRSRAASKESSKTPTSSESSTGNSTSELIKITGSAGGNSGPESASPSSSGRPPPPSSLPPQAKSVSASPSEPSPPGAASDVEVSESDETQDGLVLTASSRPPPVPPRRGSDGKVIQPDSSIASVEAPALPAELRAAAASKVDIDTSRDTPIPPATSWAPAPPAAVVDSSLPSITLPPSSAPVLSTEEVSQAKGEDLFRDLDETGKLDVEEKVEDFSPLPDGLSLEEVAASESSEGAQVSDIASDPATAQAPAIPPADRKPPPPRRTTKPALPKAKKLRKKPWWETLFGDDFSRAYRPMTPSQLIREVDFILSRLEIPPGSVILDLGCGQGEICVELARRGYSVVGYDLSVFQLAMAGDHAQAAGQKINFLQGDMREMAFEQMFDAVICWDTTFGYFEEDKNLEVLARIKKALKPHGRLLLDVMNRDFAGREAPYTHWFEGDGCVCMDDMSLDWITNRLNVKRSIILDDGRSKELNYTTRLYNLSEVGRMLHDSGFRVASVSGDVATVGAFFGPHSRRIIIQAGKP